MNGTGTGVLISMTKVHKKRVISLEHLAALQEGAKRARLLKKRVKRLSEHGLKVEDTMSRTERLLNSVRRK